MLVNMVKRVSNLFFCSTLAASEDEKLAYALLGVEKEPSELGLAIAFADWQIAVRFAGLQGALKI